MLMIAVSGGIYVWAPSFSEALASSSGAVSKKHRFFRRLNGAFRALTVTNITFPQGLQ